MRSFLMIPVLLLFVLACAPLVRADDTTGAAPAYDLSKVNEALDAYERDCGEKTLPSIQLRNLARLPHWRYGGSFVGVDGLGSYGGAFYGPEK